MKGADGGRAAWRLALGLWLAFGVVTWNAVFDHGVRIAAREFVDRQQAFVRGHGPRVIVRDMMLPATAAAANRATAWSLVAAGPGLAVLAWLARGRRPPARSSDPANAGRH